MSDVTSMLSPALSWCAALSWVQQAHRAWMGDDGGSVVNVSSAAGLKPAPGMGFYGASKAMLSHITAELAVEIRPNIRVNAVAPAVAKTRFVVALYEGREDQVAESYPLKRLGLPQDIGSVVAFLLSQRLGLGRRTDHRCRRRPDTGRRCLT